MFGKAGPLSSSGAWKGGNKTGRGGGDCGHGGITFIRKLIGKTQKPRNPEEEHESFLCTPAGWVLGFSERVSTTQTNHFAGKLRVEAHIHLIHTRVSMVVFSEFRFWGRNGNTLKEPHFPSWKP